MRCTHKGVHSVCAAAWTSHGRCNVFATLVQRVQTISICSQRSHFLRVLPRSLALPSQPTWPGNIESQRTATTTKRRSTGSEWASSVRSPARLESGVWSPEVPEHHHDMALDLDLMLKIKRRKCFPKTNWNRRGAKPPSFSSWFWGGNGPLRPQNSTLSGPGSSK